MARAGCRPNGLQKLEGDDVEKSLELLDKVLSEFEDPDSLPHIEPESPSQGNQSEDDGYMSMNGRRAKIPPDFHQQQQQHQQQEDHKIPHEQASDESSVSPPAMAEPPAHPIPTEETKSEEPPPPEVAEAIISNLLPRSGSINATELNHLHKINSPRHHHLVRQQSQDLCEHNNLTLVPPNYINGDDKGGGRIDIDGARSGPTISGDTGSDVGNYDDGEHTTGAIMPQQQQHNDKSNINIPETQIPSQATLPKTRPSTVIPSRYSSLPCSGPARSFDGSPNGMGPGGMRAAMGSGSFDGGGGRNILGIGISAVHDAVLRGGVAKLLPEPIVNEHPVTIYPGRASPPRGRVPPRTLPGSVERHREVCRNLNALDQHDGNMIDPCTNKIFSPSHQQFVISKSPSSPVMIVQKPKAGLLCHSNSSSSTTNSSFSNNQTNHMIIDNKMLFGNLQIPPRKRTNELNGTDSVSKRGDGRGPKDTGASSESTDEEFSDDSLEGQSLPPPPPPPIVPPPPSLSAPVTPSKRGSIAWEINLDDHLPPPPPAHLHQQLNHVSASGSSSAPTKSKKKMMSNKEKAASLKLDTSSSSSAKVIPRRRGRSVSGGSQSSLASTPSGGGGGGSLSNNHSPRHHNLRHRSGSVEWPEPPDPPVCSTEDEAASLYSDSDDVIPTYPANMTGQGTYVIRKGRRERNRLPELNASMSSSINSRLSNEAISPAVSQLNSLFVPNSRHSIDLGASSQMPPPISHHNSLLSPRSRLSLDLSSPNSTSELPQQSVIHASSSGNMMLGQQRYNDYKAFNNSTAAHYQQQQKHHQQHDDAQCGIGSSNHIESNGNGVAQMATTHHSGSSSSLNNNNNSNSANNGSNSSLNGPPQRVPSLSGMAVTSQQQQHQQSTQNDVITTTPRRELAPPIEEDEEQDSESQRGAPLREIENNISALLRGDISVARVGDISHHRRPLAFRPGVHKSESAKEMLLSQAAVFGPLPPSPPSSSPEVEIDGFPPLPPSPLENAADDEGDADDDIVRGLHGIRISSRTRLHFSRDRDSFEHPPAVPPHRSQPSVNTLKTRSMDAGYTKKYSSSSSSHSGGPGTLPGDMPPTSSSRRRLMSGAYPKRSAQSPREERRLQTSCSLPETPIFARGCDIPRTPHRRAPDLPTSGSRTAPRTNTATAPTLNSSIVGIGNGKEKDPKRDKEAYATSAIHRSPGSAGDIPIGQNGTAQTNGSNHHHKKKGFFKSFWKKSKHYSLEQ
ncbi:uncharacterized protein LOC119650644 isoform X3 [Hermetia illucens]|uniref:uncharacterized protein LOC119650644 isoform X3 n=1 Tax=Hermetia illucens TaxID=343691 RepID=UPI0018CC077B|nr:uncharacterized protein LOC119650644 isoform X3 [Hermetia illucens]